MKYHEAEVTAYLAQHGLPEPEYELRFHDVRRWRFDLAWPDQKLALEVQGGVFLGKKGRHTNGADLIKEWEKLNTAASMGWRMLFCQPVDLMTRQTVEFIRKSLIAYYDE